MPGWVGVSCVLDSPRPGDKDGGFLGRQTAWQCCTGTSSCMARPCQRPLSRLPRRIPKQAAPPPPPPGGPRLKAVAPLPADEQAEGFTWVGGRTQGRWWYTCIAARSLRRCCTHAHVQARTPSHTGRPCAAALLRHGTSRKMRGQVRSGQVRSACPCPVSQPCHAVRRKRAQETSTPPLVMDVSPPSRPTAAQRRRPLSPGHAPSQPLPQGEVDAPRRLLAGTSTPVQQQTMPKRM